MAAYQVTCITKPDRNSTHEHITHLGGTGWYKTRAIIIQEIESKTNSYYTKDPNNGKVATVLVRERNGVKYVQTYADGDWNNNLLSLPDCGK